MSDNAGADALSSLGVDVRSVAAVERDVVAAAEASAAEAEDFAYLERDAVLAGDIAHLQAEISRKRDPPATATETRLLRRKIAQAQQRRDALRAAHDARKLIAQSQNADDKIREKQQFNLDKTKNSVQRESHESQRDFEIRTGKITPFHSNDVHNAMPVRRRANGVLGIPKSSTASCGEPSKEKKVLTRKRPRAVSNDDELDSEYDPSDGDHCGHSSDIDSQSYTSRSRRKQKGLEHEDEEEEEEEVVLDGGLFVPASLYDRLFDYQRTGLQWFWELHTQQCGGILADEMGLGKTIQVVAFLAALHRSRKLAGPVLVVAPATVLKQWSREFQNWYAHFHVRILHHAAANMERRSKTTRPASNDSVTPASVVRDVTLSNYSGVLVTSYEQVRKHQNLLLDIFEYVILDEGHKIRNPDAEITLVCKQFHTPHRILLTGTPLQNNLRELWSLFDFVHPGRLGTLVVFDAQFTAPISLGGYANATKSQVHTAYRCAVTLKDLVSPYMLRRLKKDVSISLPDKQEHVLFCKLTPEQREAYKHFLQSRTVRQVLNGRLNLLFAITVLRKICNHVDIATVNPQWDGPRYCSASSVKRNEADAQINMNDDDDGDISSSDPDFGNWQRSGKMKVLDAVLSSWHREGSRALIFSQTKVMLTILSSFATARGYTFRRMDGQSPIASRMQTIDEFNNDNSIFLFLLTSRVGGLGINLTGADRVLLFDPDWNPSTDLQARERAWRIGQRKSVTIYRFITSGTIEEKIYHRQIYKQFLSNKVLNDPRQRRFFKRKDMRDLFSLGGEDEEGTETADLFAGTGAEKNDSGRSEANSSAKDTDDSAVPDSSANLLKSLFDGAGGGTELHSMMNHDDIMDAGHSSLDTELVKYEAEKIVSKAIAEVRRSSRERSRESVSVPTWTGRSGLAGIPRRDTSASIGAAGGAAELLRKIKQREGGVLSKYETAPKSGTTESGSTTEDLIRSIIAFLESRGGSASSDDVVSRFSGQVGEGKESLVIFKSLLKGVAVLDRKRASNGTPEWVLKDEYKDGSRTHTR